jgi:arsenate reductase
MPVHLFHNPACSKSRATLALLREKGIEPAIRLYLETPPDAAELQELLGKLALEPAQLVRRGEALFRELGLHEGEPGNEQLLTAMAAHPRLIERPIVVAGDKAAIGRPPENVLAIL